MSSPLGRLALTASVLLVACAWADCRAADQPQKITSTDMYGDPLPPGVVARLGTVRFRHAGTNYLAFSADGNRLVSFDNYSGAFRVWETKSGKPIWQSADSYSEVAFFPGGDAIALTSHRGSVVRVVAIPSGRELWRQAPPPAHGFSHLALSQDGRVLAALAWKKGDKRESQVHLWDARTGKSIREPLRGRFHDLRLFADGKTLATLDGLSTTLWDVPSGEELRTWKADAAPTL